MKVERDFCLLEYNTFGIGSVADTFVELSSREDFEEFVASGMLRGQRYFVLGGGSNVVITSRYDGIVVHPANSGVTLVDRRDGYCYVEAQAGEKWSDFVDFCIGNGWYGVENMAGIPGCVGASPVQNVGAYGSEAKDVVWRVHCYDLCDGSEKWIDASECGFAYRWSRFKGEWKDRYLIDRVLFRLRESFLPNLTYGALASALAGDEGDITARRVADTVVALRDSKLPNPAEVGSAGSFFKNPVVSADVYEDVRGRYPDIVAFAVGDGRYKLAAGWMIERCGWKGRSLGRAGVYEKQSLVLVNRGGCNDVDVRTLCNAVASDVESRFGVRLEPEVIFVENR